MGTLKRFPFFPAGPALFSLATVIVLFVIQPVLAGEVAAAPSGITYELIGTYSAERLNTVLTQELKDFSAHSVKYPPARCGVKLYRVLYPSVVPEQGNRPTRASGLLAVPETAAKGNPVISYQHGTVFSKTEVPSRPDESMETRLTLAQFAGQGYVVVAADYFGKGSSSEKDSYLVKESTQQACLDMLTAAQEICTELKVPWGPLFLSGWSQGGWSTMVFLNKLEAIGRPVRAAATASAPEDLFAIINRWIHAPEKQDAEFLPGLLALQLNAYEEYDALPGLADTAIQPEYRKAARDLYLNKLTWTEAHLPKKLSDLLQPGFVAESSIGTAPYWQILQKSQAYRWRSKTPLRIYYGDQDEVVPASIATLPVEYQKVMKGADTQAVLIGQGNHRGTFVEAVAKQKEWFDSFIGP